jgi:hypothetical protein
VAGETPHSFLVARRGASHKPTVAELFDMKLRAMRRDRAARIGPELFLLERAFGDCLDRVALMRRQFRRALLIGCPDAAWPQRLRQIAARIDTYDPGPLFAAAVKGTPITEDAWEPPPATYDLVIAIGTLDTVNDLVTAIRFIRRSMLGNGLFIGAFSGGDTLPQLRAAMRAADAAAHVHPRIEPSALSPLLSAADFVNVVVDVDRVDVSYSSLGRLVADLRAMGATNVLRSRAPPLTRAQTQAATRAFADAGDGQRTTETFEILHFAAWTPANG